VVVGAAELAAVGAELAGAELTGAALTGVALAGAGTDGVGITEGELDGVELSGVEITGVRITGVGTTGVDPDSVDRDSATVVAALPQPAARTASPTASTCLAFISHLRDISDTTSRDCVGLCRPAVSSLGSCSERLHDSPLFLSILSTRKHRLRRGLLLCHSSVLIGYRGRGELSGHACPHAR
jgi:hypothetical protein